VAYSIRKNGPENRDKAHGYGIVDLVKAVSKNADIETPFS
jgi:hypothetical protein